MYINVMKFEYLRSIFEKSAFVNFLDSLLMTAELLHDDGQTDT